jgi:flagella synthesis protein FlgN
MSSPLTTLREEQQLITSLVDLMKQEQQFLVNADSEGLARLTPRKSSMVQQMALLGRQRHQALGEAGFAARDAGMDDWLASSKDEDARGLWLALLERTCEAKELNRVNGMLINKQMTNTQNVLNALFTPAGGSGAGVYGPSGQTSVSGPSRRYVVG